VLLAVRLVFGAQNIAWVGYGVLLVCLVVWLLSRAFRNLLKGKAAFRHPVATVLGLTGGVLVTLGSVKLWELISKASDWNFVREAYHSARGLVSSLF